MYHIVGASLRKMLFIVRTWSGQLGQSMLFWGEVINVEEPKTVYSKLKHKSQYILIADGTCSSRGVLWEMHVSVVSGVQCYHFQNMWISLYNKCKYFTFPESASCEQISEMGSSNTLHEWLLERLYRCSRWIFTRVAGSATVRWYKGLMLWLIIINLMHMWN